MLRSVQLGEPFIYNLGAAAIPASGGTAKTLRQLIATITGGAVPPRVGIVAFEIIPDETIRMYGGWDPQSNTFRAAAEGGGYTTIDDQGSGFPISDPLDNIRFKADANVACTGVIVLYTSGQAGG